MKNILILGIFTMILGVLSSLIGGFLCTIFHIKTKRTISILYELTAGIMTGIVCFEMLPESFEISSLIYSLIGIIIGVMVIYILDILVYKFSKKSNTTKKVALVVMISMAIHNIIEGLAVGSGFSFSLNLGITVLLGIFLHDIPEGMIVGITSKVSGKKNKNIMIETAIVGACGGIGTFIGNYIGKIDDRYISLSLSVAAGAMLYLVACELLPESKMNSKSKNVYLMYIIGIVLGALLSRI